MYPAIGPVSSDTLRPQDLIPRFEDVLNKYAPERAAAIRADFPGLFTDDDGDLEYADAEDLSNCLDALFDALEEISPPYASFSSSEGDGACFGFWPEIEEGDDILHVGPNDDWALVPDLSAVAKRYKDGSLGVFPNTNAQTPTTHAPAKIAYVAVVNDHGNLALYDAITGAEIWSVV